MRNILEGINNNKKLILGIILSPIILYSLNVILICIFKMGTYLGTFLRHLYAIVVC